MRRARYLVAFFVILPPLFLLFLQILFLRNHRANIGTLRLNLNWPASVEKAYAQAAPPAPDLLHPRQGEEIRVNRPYFNLENVGTDNENYVYDIRVFTDTHNITSTIVVTDTSVPQLADNHGVTYWQSPDQLNEGTTYYWQARARLPGNSDGPWSVVEPLTITNVWSPDGDIWHWPLERRDARLSGTFMEGYFHDSYNGFGLLHTGIDVAVMDVDVRAARSGKRGEALPHFNLDNTGGVRLIHEHPLLSGLNEETNYLHMRDRTDLPVGTYINQGTSLGTASDVGAPGKPHLHFDYADAEQQSYYNPLALNMDGWTPPASADPTVTKTYLRSDRLLDASSTGITGNTYIIAQTVDPALNNSPPPAGQRLAPYRVEFFVDDERLHDIRFDGHSGEDHETDYYAYRSAGAARETNPAYLLYFKWDTSDLPADFGSHTIRVVSSDFYGISGPRVMKIGPELSAAPDSVPLDRCGDEQVVTLSIHNHNDNIEGEDRDTYQLTVEANGVDARLDRDSITISNGESGNVDLTISGDTAGTVTITAASGIVMDIKDQVVIDVNVAGGAYRPSGFHSSPDQTCPGDGPDAYNSYTLKVIAKTGQAGLTEIEDSPSINDKGTVAFVGKVTGGEAIFAGDGSGDPNNITPGFVSGERTFSRAVQINDHDQVVARDLETGPSLHSRVRKWDANSIDSPILVASGLFGNPGVPFNLISSYPSINNADDVVFTALGGHGSLLNKCPDTCLVTPICQDCGVGWADRFNVEPLVHPLRPLIADDGRIVVRAGDQPTDPIRLYANDFRIQDTITVANTAMGFTALGRSPGISDDGKIVTFYGELDSNGAVRLQMTPGPGIFAAMYLPSGWSIHRIAGVAGNGHLDPGETWNDLNYNGVVDGGEDQGPFSSFSVDSRVGVSVRLAAQDVVTITASIVYMAQDTSGKPGLYASPLVVDTANESFDPGEPIEIIEAGDRIPTLTGTVQNLAIYDPTNASGQVAFWAKMDTGNQVVVRADRVRRPVLIVPGIAGTLGRDLDFWLMNRGVDPRQLQIDPLKGVYNDLVQTLKNTGYISGTDLFIANYDWRLPPAPIDGTIDGEISDIFGFTITDGVYEYGVDYLGYWLGQAAKKWADRYPNSPLDAVDVIAHSTGGLVVRSYIQSRAYGDSFPVSSGDPLNLPKISNFIMIGVPNRGASKAWNPLHDNWVVDPAYRLVLSRLLKNPYKRVLERGEVVNGPPEPIASDDITDAEGNPDPAAFINLYVPTMRYLLATYDFIAFGSGLTNVNDDPAQRNFLILDLNAGRDMVSGPVGDPNAFADEVDKLVVIYGTGEDTATTVRKQRGRVPDFSYPIMEFTRNSPRPPGPKEDWFRDIEQKEGDETVPVTSAIGQFQGDNRIDLRGFTAGASTVDGVTHTEDDATHTGLMANIDVQKLILETLGFSPEKVQLSTSEGGASLGRIYAIMSLDPVDALLVDANGNRLGYSQAAGAVTEIPNSVWFGQSEGIGWILGPFAAPLQLQLTGYGEEYDVQVYTEREGQVGGLQASGFLAQGEQQSYAVRTRVGVTDVNGDSVTNIMDIMQVAAAWGATPADADWNPDLDVNADLKVDIEDITWVAYGWGTVYEATPTPTGTPTVTPTPTLTATPTPTPTPSVTPAPIGQGASVPFQMIFGLGDINALAFSPDGQQALLGGSRGFALLVDANTWTIQHHLFGHTDAITGVAFSPDGTRVLTGSNDHTARLWDAASGMLLRTFTGHTTDVTSVAFSPDGGQVLTGAKRWDDAAWLWDAATGEVIRKFEGHTGAVLAVAFSGDGTQVLTGSDDQTARLWGAATGTLIRTLAGHTSQVNAVAFSPDGAQVLTGSSDSTARLWDVTTGAYQTLAGHNYSVYAVAFSPDGGQVLTGSRDSSARLWDAGSSDLIHSFWGHTSHVLAVAFSPDGSRVLTGSSDGTARLWDVTLGTNWSYEGHTADVNAVAISSDGTRVLTGSDDSTARLWDATTRDLLRTFEGHTSGVTSVALSPDGSQVLTGSWDKTARLWDASSGDVLHTFTGHTQAVKAVAISSDGTQVLTGSNDNTARLYRWDATTETWEYLRSFVGHTYYVNGVAFSPDGSQVLTGSWDKTARLWDAATGDVLRTFEGHGGWVTSVAFSPDGSQVLTGSGDRTARLWDVSSGASCIFRGGTGTVNAVAFSPDSSQVLTGNSDGGARLWDVATGDFLRTLGHGAAVNAVAFSPDGTQVLTGGVDDTARLWDVAGLILHTFWGGHTSWMLSETPAAFSPDGSRVLTGGRDMKALLWDAATGDVLRTFAGHTGTVTAVAYSPDGTQVLTGSRDGTARLWDVASGMLHTLQVPGPGGNTVVLAVAFSPDGAQMLTGSNVATAVLWDTATGELLRTFEGHGADVNAVAFSPDGAQILTGSNDGAAVLWDAASGTILASFGGHTGNVNAVAFSPDGSQVLTAGADGTARLWHAATGLPLRTFQNPQPGSLPVACNSVTFSPDGTQVLTGNQDQTARLWDTATGVLLRIYQGLANPVTVAFSSDGETVLAGGHDHTARLWGAATRGLLRTFEGHTSGVTSVALSPDGMQVLTGSWDHTVRLWDAAAGAQISTFQGHRTSVTSVTFSPDGTQALTGDSLEAHLWETATGNSLRGFRGHGYAASSAIFSPDSSQVLTGGQDQNPAQCLQNCASAKLWDAATGQLIRTFSHLSSVNSVAFSPDGSRVLTGSGDNQARLWDAATGDLIRTFANHTSWVNAVAYSPDGTRMVTGSEDQTARLWDVATGAVLHVFTHPEAVKSVAFAWDGSWIVTTAGHTAYVWDTTTADLLFAVSHAENVTSAVFSPDGTQVLTGSWDDTARLWTTVDQEP